MEHPSSTVTPEGTTAPAVSATGQRYSCRVPRGWMYGDRMEARQGTARQTQTGEQGGTAQQLSKGSSGTGGHKDMNEGLKK